MYAIEWYTDGRWWLLAGTFATREKAEEKRAQYQAHHSSKAFGLYRIVRV